MSFASSGIVIPLCLPEISKTLNISLSQGGAMETARTFIIVAVLLISGILANRWGKKPLMAIGQYLIAIGAIMASYSLYGINFYTEALENLERYLKTHFFHLKTHQH